MPSVFLLHVWLSVSCPLLTVFLHLFLKYLNTILFCYLSTYFLSTYLRIIFYSPPQFQLCMVSPHYCLESSSLTPAAINLLMSALVLSVCLLHMLMWAYYNFQDIGFVHVHYACIIAVEGSCRNLLGID